VTGLQGRRKESDMKQVEVIDQIGAAPAWVAVLAVLLGALLVAAVAPAQPTASWPEAVVLPGVHVDAHLVVGAEGLDSGRLDVLWVPDDWPDQAQLHKLSGYSSGLIDLDLGDIIRDPVADIGTVIVGAIDAGATLTAYASAPGITTVVPSSPLLPCAGADLYRAVQGVVELRISAWVDSDAVGEVAEIEIVLQSPATEDPGVDVRYPMSIEIGPWGGASSAVLWSGPSYPAPPTVAVEMLCAETEARDRRPWSLAVESRVTATTHIVVMAVAVDGSVTQAPAVLRGQQI
jgi:hypothetical protein